MIIPKHLDLCLNLKRIEQRGDDMRFNFKATEITEEGNTIIFEIEVEASDIFEAQKIALADVKRDKRFRKRNVEDIHIKKIHQTYTVRFSRI